jgi:hypothetical protein
MTEIPIRPDVIRAEAQQRAIERQLREQLRQADAEEKIRREERAQRVPKPSDDGTRYSRGRGTAGLKGGYSVMPLWLIEAIPSVKTVYDAWQSENAIGRELAATADSAKLELDALSHRDYPGAPHQRAAGVTVGDYEAALARLADAEAQLGPQANRARAALEVFDDLSVSRVVAPERTDAAARQAVASHAAAVDAWAALSVALKTRDQAYRYAGTPGRAWTTRQSLGAMVARSDGGASEADRIMTARLDGFPIEAVESIAKGA